MDVPPEPNLSFSPDRKLVLQLYRPPPLPPISELARPELKLAGSASCMQVLATIAPCIISMTSSIAACVQACALTRS